MKCESTLLRMLDRVEIKTLPTNAHFDYFLHSAYAPESPTSAYEAWTGLTGSGSRSDPSFIAERPSLVILHDPSQYLDEPGNQSTGIETYGSLLALFIATFATLYPDSPPLLILHDSQTSFLKLPVIPLSLQKNSKKRKVEHEGDGDDYKSGEDEEDGMRLNRVASYFFQVEAIVEQTPLSPSSALDESYRHHTLTLRPTRRHPSYSSSSSEQRDGIKVEYTTHEGRSDDSEGGPMGLKFELW